MAKKMPRKMPDKIGVRWNFAYLWLHDATSYRNIIDAFIVPFNGPNPSTELKKTEKYEWDIFIALQNILQVF